MATMQFPFRAKASNTPTVVTKDTHMVDADGGDILNISMSDFVEQKEDEGFPLPQCVEDKENCAGSQLLTSSKVFGASKIKTQISALTSRVFPSSRKNEYAPLVDNSAENVTEDTPVHMKDVAPAADQLFADNDLATSELVDPAVPEMTSAGNKTRSSLLEKPLWEPKHGAQGLFSPKTAYTPMGTGRRSRIHSTGGAGPRADATRGTGVQPRHLGVKPTEGLSKSMVHSKRCGSAAEGVPTDLSRTCVFSEKEEQEEGAEKTAEGRLFALTASARARVKAGPPQAPPAVSSSKPRFKTVVRTGGQGIFSPTAPVHSTTTAMEAADLTSVTAEKSILSASALTPKARLLAPTASSAAKAVRKHTECPGTGTGTRGVSSGDADVAYAVLGSLPCLPPSTEKPLLSAVVVEEEDGSWDFAYPTSPPPRLSPTQQLPPMLEPHQVECSDDAGKQGCEGYAEMLEVTDEESACSEQLACLPASPATSQDPLCQSPTRQGTALSSPIKPQAGIALLASPVSPLSRSSTCAEQQEQAVTGTTAGLHSATGSAAAAPVEEEMIDSAEEKGQVAPSTSPSCGAVPVRDVRSPALGANEGEHDLQSLLARLSTLGVYTSGGSQASHTTQGSTGTRYSGKSWGATATQHCLGTASAVLASLQSAHVGSTRGTFSLPQWAMEGGEGIGAQQQQQQAEDVVMAGETKGVGVPPFQSPGAATVASAGIASLARSRSKVSLVGASQHNSRAVGGTGWSMRSPPPVHGSASSASGSVARSALPLPDLSPDGSHTEGQDRRGSDALTVLESYCSTPMGTVMGSTGLTQGTRPDSVPPGEEGEGGGMCTPTIGHSTGAVGAGAGKAATPGEEEIDLSALLARLQSLGVHVSGQSYATHGSKVSRASGKSWGATATAQCLTTAASVLAALHSDSSVQGALAVCPEVVVGEQAEEQERPEQVTASPCRDSGATGDVPADESTTSVSSATPRRRPGLWVKTTTPSTARMSSTCKKGKASPLSAQGTHTLSMSAFTSPVPSRALSLQAKGQEQEEQHRLESASSDNGSTHTVSALVAGLVRDVMERCGTGVTPETTGTQTVPVLESDQRAGQGELVVEGAGEEEGPGALMSPLPAHVAAQSLLSPVPAAASQLKRTQSLFMSPRRTARLQARVAAEGAPSVIVEAVAVQGYRVVKEKAGGGLAGLFTAMSSGHAVYILRYMVRRTEGRTEGADEARPQAQLAAAKAGLQRTLSRKGSRAFMAVRSPVRGAGSSVPGQRCEGVASPRVASSNLLSPQRRVARPASVVRLLSPREALLSQDRTGGAATASHAPGQSSGAPSSRSVVTVSKRYSDFQRLWATLSLHLQAALSAQQRGKLTALRRYGLPATLLEGGTLQAVCDRVESFPFPAKARLGGTEVAVMLARQKAFDSMLAMLQQYQLTQLQLVKQFLGL